MVKILKNYGITLEEINEYMHQLDEKSSNAVEIWQGIIRNHTMKEISESLKLSLSTSRRYIVKFLEQVERYKYCKEYNIIDNIKNDEYYEKIFRLIIESDKGLKKYINKIEINFKLKKDRVLGNTIDNWKRNIFEIYLRKDYIEIFIKDIKTDMHYIEHKYIDYIKQFGLQPSNNLIMICVFLHEIGHIKEWIMYSKLGINSSGLMKVNRTYIDTLLAIMNNNNRNPSKNYKEIRHSYKASEIAADRYLFYNFPRVLNLLKENNLL